MIYVAIASFVAGAVLAYLSRLEEIRYLRAELKSAHNQIAHAVIQEHAIIPPREEPIEPIKPLSDKLQETVAQWEGAEAQATTVAAIRKHLSDGYSEKAIINMYGGA